MYLFVNIFVQLHVFGDLFFFLFIFLHMYFTYFCFYKDDKDYQKWMQIKWYWSILVSINLFCKSKCIVSQNMLNVYIVSIKLLNNC